MTIVDNSGIDLCWIEAGLYGSATVKQIIDGNHVRRGERAHVITLQALFTLYQEAFSQQHPKLRQSLEKAAETLNHACTESDRSKIEEAHAELASTIDSLKVVEEMSRFDAINSNQPLFRVVKQYMKMVLEMLQFIRAVRTADWELHLMALETFTKYFFAHDKVNYARMIPLYLAEMKSLKETDLEIYNEFMEGNWVVNKNPDVPFCALGADHALEHINRSMKVTGGLVGITLNPSARTKFFLIAPELARLAEEAQEMAGLSSKTPRRHHALSAATFTHQEKALEDLIAMFRCFTNPFSEQSNDLFNLVTKVVVPEKIKEDLCNQSQIGQKLFEAFVCDRIQSNKTNLWAPMKKHKLSTWKDMAKKMKLSAGDKVVELQEDRSLFARMMVVCKSRPEINLKEAIGQYEFSVVPKSLFVVLMGQCIIVP